MTKEDRSEQARLIAGLRRRKSGGRNGGRPRSIPHKREGRGYPTPGCRCYDCREARKQKPKVVLVTKQGIAEDDGTGARVISTNFDWGA